MSLDRAAEILPLSVPAALVIGGGVLVALGVRHASALRRAGLVTGALNGAALAAHVNMSPGRAQTIVLSLYYYDEAARWALALLTLERARCVAHARP